MFEGAQTSGAVILARHGRPALSRRTLLSADDYRDWWATYEAGGLKAGQVVPENLKAIAVEAGAIIASTRRRSVETATLLGAGREFHSDAMFIEAPLPPPPWPRWLKLPPMAWGFLARVWWWFLNHHPNEESRLEAEKRAEEAAGRLIEVAGGGRDVLVLAHGFFNAMIARALRRRGWRCTLNGGYGYWAARRFEAPSGRPSPSARVTAQ
ncbi:MAG TPA: histidine phosphatase family protein [Caulobacteraceae bacterium]|jgi:broad specificity phosphatase PhoE|nr:histidine phosphatase family protein [Caulobacteraceae bacterium]